MLTSVGTSPSAPTRDCWQRKATGNAALAYALRRAAGFGKAGCRPQFFRGGVAAILPWETVSRNLSRYLPRTVIGDIAGIIALDHRDAGVMAGGDDADRDAGEQLPDDAAVAQRVHRHFGRILAAGSRYSPERIGLVRSFPRFTAWPGERRRVRRPIHRRQPFREFGRDRDRIMRLRLVPFALSLTPASSAAAQSRRASRGPRRERSGSAGRRSPPRARQTAQIRLQQLRWDRDGGIFAKERLILSPGFNGRFIKFAGD